MTDHNRAADEAIIKLAEGIGEIRGRQDQIVEVLKEQAMHRREDKEAHDRIYDMHSALHDEVLGMKSRMDDVPHRLHREHHDYIDHDIALKKARRELCEKVKVVLIERALPYALLSLVAAGLYLLGAKQTGANLIDWINR